MFGQEQNPIHSSRLNPGIFFILFGVLYLFPANGLVDWWAFGLVMAFLPVVWVIHCLWQSYKETGMLHSWLISRLLWSLFPISFMVLAYSDLDMGRWWPFFFIFIGLPHLFGRGRR